MDRESLLDEKVKVLKCIPALGAEDVVRGQFRGYRQERGVAVDSQVETFAAVRLRIESWPWQGVPFYIRTGKCLPVTSTEVVDPVLTANTPVREYEPGTWGPADPARTSHFPAGGQTRR